MHVCTISNPHLTSTQGPSISLSSAICTLYAYDVPSLDYLFKSIISTQRTNTKNEKARVFFYQWQLAKWVARLTIRVYTHTRIYVHPYIPIPIVMNSSL